MKGPFGRSSRYSRRADGATAKAARKSATATAERRLGRALAAAGDADVKIRVAPKATGR